VADASYVQSSFSGGEWSKFAQGRYHDERYRKALNVCLNLIPQETESIVRRPGFLFAGTTRNGAPGRVVSLAFQQTNAYTMEFTDGHLRLRSGLNFVTANDSVAVTAISAANPAVVTTASPVTWSSDDRVFFTNLSGNAVLQNRVFIVTKLTTTTFSLTDAITSANIDGSTIGAFGTGTINRILDITTPYIGGTWASLRSVQTETTTFLLQGTLPPQALVVVTQPTPTAFATFSFAPAVFNDGPYLDPFKNGVQVTPSAKSGIITLTMSFPAYSATTAYAKGSFVTSAAVNYESLVDQNVNNTPAGSPSQWAVVSAGAAINDGRGFLASDIGRLVRLYSEPAPWLAGTTYASGAVVSYNPSGLPGQTTYWSSLVAGNIGNVPGTDLTHWQLLPQGGTSSPAQWSWGKITSLTNAISGTLPGSANIGDETNDGGLAAAFNGTISQPAASCASKQTGAIGSFPPGNVSLTSYIGKDYSGASDQVITQAIVYPPSDGGFIGGGLSFSFNVPFSAQSFVINLRGKASLPGSSSDGTLLATSGTVTNMTAPVVLNTTSPTAWKYVWIEMVSTITSSTPTSGYKIINRTSQLVLVGPPGTGTTTGVNVAILGPPLLYTNTITTWRLGTYSDTTGYPTCGTYSESRLWLSGVVANRVDASVAGGINTTTGAVDFAPTDQYGNVLASSGMSEVFSAPDTNPIFWMMPDLQGLTCGTRAGEWLIAAPTPGAISPFNISARRATTIGCANINAIRTEHTTMFVQKFQRKIMEFFADVFSGKYTAPHITYWSKHLTIGNVAEIAYQQELNPVVWARLEDGALVGWTYKRDTLSTSTGPTIAAGHRHTLGSGQTVTSICTGPNVGGNLDALTIVAFDAATGLYHVEVLGDSLDEGSSLIEANYLDDAITPTSTSSSSSTPSPYGGLTLNGLWYLNGKTVTAWLAGMDCGDYVVSNGSITVPYGDGIAAGTANGLFTFAAWNANPVALVGFTYTSQGQVVRVHDPKESGARSGPALGKKRRNHYFMALLEGTQGVSFGTDFSTNIMPAIFRYDGGKVYPITAQFSGVWRDAVKNDYDFDGMLCWQVTRPYICNIAAIGGALSTQDV
jgi:hypothetical protein